jgi:hypothetical protein
MTEVEPRPPTYIILLSYQLSYDKQSLIISPSINFDLAASKTNKHKYASFLNLHQWLKRASPNLHRSMYAS